MPARTPFTQQLIEPAVKTLQELLGAQCHYGKNLAFPHYTSGEYIEIEVPPGVVRTDLRTRVRKLLTSFYAANCDQRAGTRLVMRRLGSFGALLLVNEDGEILELQSQPSARKMRKKFALEFQRFAKFISSYCAALPVPPHS